MSQKTRQYFRVSTFLVLILVFLTALIMFSLTTQPAQAGGGAASPTATLSLINIQKIPLMVFTPVPLSNSILKYSTILNISNLLNASLDLQSPPNIPLGESKVITLQITPSVLQSKSSQIRAKLSGVSFQIADDGQPDKTLEPGATVNWSWVVSSSSPGQQALLLAISYLDQKGNVTAQWENMPINIDISNSVPSPTPESLSNQIIKNLADNTATLIGVAATLILGLVGLYLQYGRKSKTDTKKN